MSLYTAYELCAVGLVPLGICWVMENRNLPRLWFTSTNRALTLKYYYHSLNRTLTQTPNENGNRNHSKTFWLIKTLARQIENIFSVFVSLNCWHLHLKFVHHHSWSAQNFLLQFFLKSKQNISKRYYFGVAMKKFNSNAEKISSFV